jgi:electron transfer flavoprotein beta subunit
LKNLDALPSDVGLEASPTKVKRSFTPDPKGAGVLLEGNFKEAPKNSW